jgi:hypothetical protein
MNGLLSPCRAAAQFNKTLEATAGLLGVFMLVMLLEAPGVRAVPQLCRLDKDQFCLERQEAEEWAE